MIGLKKETLGPKQFSGDTLKYWFAENSISIKCRSYLVKLLGKVTKHVST